jgi:hypothetical protein
VNGDFDLVSAQQTALETVMMKHGFIRPSGPGIPRGAGFIDLKLGFEVVGSRLLDGYADTSLLQMIEMKRTAHGVISVEDLIADRMGQYASGAARECWDRPKRYSPFLKALISIIWNSDSRRNGATWRSRPRRRRVRPSASPRLARIAERRLVIVGAVDVPTMRQAAHAIQQALLDEIAKAGGQW